MSIVRAFQGTLAHVESPAPRTADYVHPSLIERVAVGEMGGFPADWREQIREAIEAGQARYREAVARTQRLDATVKAEPKLSTFGWRIAVQLDSPTFD